MRFYADTVKIGERYIVAVEDGGSFATFTSRHSLFTLDQYDEIIKWIE